MISEERMLSFIDSFHSDNSSLLKELEQYAGENHVPIIRPSMQELLKLLITMKRPQNILEVGCAIGFSTLLMAEHAPRECRITTIEKYEKRIPVAKENFIKADRENQIVLLEGDAAEILKNLKEPFDFIFMDAAKGQYLFFMPEVIRLLAPGGVLVSDNVLQEGDVLESRFAVTRRNRTIHSRMRQYLYELKNNPQLCTDILPVGDGVTVSVKTEA